LLSPGEIERFYLGASLMVPNLWNLSRKHFQAKLREGRFIKLNKFENRLSAKDVKFYCCKLKPLHVYFSVLNW
jgi:hypothetical protein